MQVNKMKPKNNTESLMAKLREDTLQYAPALIIPALLNVVAVMLYTRIFSPQEYGVYTLIINTVNLVSSIFSQWIMQSTQKYRPQYIKDGIVEKFNSHLLLLLIIITIILLIGSIIILFPINLLFENMSNLIYFSAISLIFMQILYNIGIVIFQSDLKASKFRSYQLLNGILKFFISIAIIFFIYKNIISIIWATVLSFALLIYPLYKENGLLKKPSIFHVNYQEFIDFCSCIFRYGLPMMGWFLSNSLLGLVDRYMISIFRGSEEVGIYVANYSLVTVGLNLICGPMLTAAHPVIMNINYNSRENYSMIQDIIKKFSRLFLLITIPLATYIIVFRNEITRILLGPSFREGSIIIPFLIIGFLLWNFSMYGHKAHEITGNTKSMLFYVLISVGINILLNIILIPYFGYVGAAIASLISYASYPVFIYFTSKKLIKWIIPWKSIGNILISSLFSGFVASAFIDISSIFFDMASIIKLIIAALIGGIVYYILLKLTKEIDNGIII